MELIKRTIEHLDNSNYAELYHKNGFDWFFWEVLNCDGFYTEWAEHFVNKFNLKLDYSEQVIEEFELLPQPTQNQIKQYFESAVINKIDDKEEEEAVDWDDLPYKERHGLEMICCMQSRISEAS